ncbi:MAG: 2-C-methyl-D-erythritol 2,4-cyclodiphosphate synthase [Deltaproteobacteria bacterium]|nr:2-C-methyl-D-erythritol 2,4-cyclodiphosphate synthase [Deltaproteobacteria bacterium]
MLKVSTGIDFHRLVEGRRLWLGGMYIPHAKGLLGHSDGDVLLHAAADAILAAAGGGDIGSLFPAEMKETDGITGKEIVGAIYDSGLAARVEIINMDVVIICDTVVLKDYMEKIRLSAAAILRISIEKISLRAKRSESLVFSESNDGIAAFCTCLCDVK